ncbi:hypothetical protein [Microbulbifer sp. TRSA007]|uniref:hypothetical protein n=1 Tax=Microbulbifer sp. TRSA007 TaxID=3243384 RepID=UPI00403934A3
MKDRSKENKDQPNARTITEDDRYIFFFHLGIGLTAFMLVVMIGLFIERPITDSNQSGIEWVQEFIKYLSPAFKVAAGCIAIIGIISLIFRSEQTARQLDHAKGVLEYEKNKSSFSSYIEHRNLFEKTIKSIEEDLKIEFKDINTFYSDSFPENEIKNFKIEISAKSTIRKAKAGIETIIEEYTEYIGQGFISEAVIINHYQKLANIYNMLHVKDHKLYTFNNYRNINFDEAIRAIDKVIEEINRISYTESVTSVRPFAIGSFYHTALRKIDRTTNIKESENNRTAIFRFNSADALMRYDLTYEPGLISLEYIPIRDLVKPMGENQTG